MPAVNPQPNALESLEGRILMKAQWGYWPDTLGLTRTIQNYPWLDGGGLNVGVVDKGIDYWHPALGGNRDNAPQRARGSSTSTIRARRRHRPVPQRQRSPRHHQSPRHRRCRHPDRRQLHVARLAKFRGVFQNFFFFAWLEYVLLQWNTRSQGFCS